MPRPTWWPVREYIATATGEWCEARCQAAEQAMARAIIAEIERQGWLTGHGTFKKPRVGLFILEAVAWDQIKREALGDD